jgi:hypothetical protein
VIHFQLKTYGKGDGRSSHDYIMFYKSPSGELTQSAIAPEVGL